MLSSSDTRPFHDYWRTAAGDVECNHCGSKLNDNREGFQRCAGSLTARVARELRATADEIEKAAHARAEHLRQQAAELEREVGGARPVRVVDVGKEV